MRISDWSSDVCSSDLTAYAAVNVSHAASFPNQFPNVPGNPDAAGPTYDFTEAWTIVTLSVAAKLGAIALGAYVANLIEDSKITYVHPEAVLDGRYARLRTRTLGVRSAESSDGDEHSSTCGYRW